jgi:hypothetical protein
MNPLVPDNQQHKNKPRPAATQPQAKKPDIDIDPFAAFK